MKKDILQNLKLDFNHIKLNNDILPLKILE